MLKSLVLATALFGLSVTISVPSANASAPVEIYSCVFTEPFFNFSYNSDTKELRKITPEVPEHIESNVQIKADETGKLLLTDHNDRLLFTLELKPGSNGMSNRVYPYQGVAKTDTDGPEGQLGGCFSTSHPLPPLP